MKDAIAVAKQHRTTQELSKLMAIRKIAHWVLAYLDF